MKKNAILVLCTVLSVIGFGQTKKGDKLVGVGFGSISYTNSNSKTSYSNTSTVYKSDGNSFSISVNPNFSWFVKDNLAIGGGISVGFYSSKNNNSNTSSSATSENTNTQPSVYIGPQVRYYFGGSPKGMPFAQFNFQYGITGGKSKSTTSGGASSETTYKPKGDWNTGLSFGYEHFITPSVGFYGSIGFNYGSSKTTYEYRPNPGTGYDYTSEYSRFYIPVNVGLQVHLLDKGTKSKK